MTLDARKNALVRRNLFTLQPNVTMEQLQKIIAELEENNYRVSEVDDLQKQSILENIPEAK